MKKKIIICTDGSAVTGQQSAFDSAGAYVIYEDMKELTRGCKVLRDHTNNYAEIYSIYAATKWCTENIKGLEEYDCILIVSDSDLTVKSLTQWMVGWLKKAEDELLINSTGVPVKNQELLKSAFINILILQLKVTVYICHMNSHKSKDKLPEMYKKFVKKFEISFDEFKMIYEGNNICDVSARESLQ